MKGIPQLKQKMWLFILTLFFVQALISVCVYVVHISSVHVLWQKFVCFACSSCRQMKDQSKKVATLKHKEQVEKNRNAQLMEEARKREDNINESSQQVKVIPALELNKALSESYSILHYI